MPAALGSQMSLEAATRLAITWNHLPRQLAFDIQVSLKGIVPSTLPQKAVPSVESTVSLVRRSVQNSFARCPPPCMVPRDKSLVESSACPANARSVLRWRRLRRTFGGHLCPKRTSLSPPWTSPPRGRRLLRPMPSGPWRGEGACPRRRTPGAKRQTRPPPPPNASGIVPTRGGTRRGTTMPPTVHAEPALVLTSESPMASLGLVVEDRTQHHMFVHRGAGRSGPNGSGPIARIVLGLPKRMQISSRTCRTTIAKQETKRGSSPQKATPRCRLNERKRTAHRRLQPDFAQGSSKPRPGRQARVTTRRSPPHAMSGRG